LVYATPDPRSYESDDTQTVPFPSLAGQAAARAAYIESILADWPAPTPKQERTIGSLLGNGSGGLSEAQYTSWEYRRHLDAETARHGYFTADGEAA
jgi:hypothetical protein